MISGTKIDKLNFNFTIGPLQTTGVFTNLTQTKTLTGVLKSNEFLELGDVNKVLSIVLDFNTTGVITNNNLPKDTELPSLLLTSLEIDQGLSILKSTILGTSLHDVKLTNILEDKEIIYNVVCS